MAETSSGEATATAILDEAESRDWGTSSDDIEAYAEIGGAAAGAAACAAVGAAPVAPLCGTVGGWAAGFIAGTIGDWCTSSAEAERARERRREVRQLHNRIDQIGAWQLLNGQMLDERIGALRELHRELWPDDPWVSTAPDVYEGQREVYPAILLLAAHGMPTEPREGPQGVMLGLPSLDARWEELRREMSDQTLFEMLQTEAIEISEAIERAYDRSVIDLTAQAAGDQAEQRAGRPTIRVVEPPPGRSRVFGEVAGVEQSGPGRVRVPSSRKSIGAASWRMGVALGGAALGSLLVRVLGRG